MMPLTKLLLSYYYLMLLLNTIPYYITSYDDCCNISSSSRGSEKPGTWHLASWYPRIVVLAPLNIGLAQEKM